jgi:hypothetical protein
MIIMPKDCYKATSGPHEGLVVRKSRMGVEIPAAYSEVRYIVSDFEKEAIEQAFMFHARSRETTTGYKIEEYAD